MTGRAFLACTVAALAVLGGCGDSPTATVPTDSGQERREVPADLVPPQLAGLTVTTEDISALEKQAGDTSYLASTRLWAFRTDKRLRATLQIGRFVPDARYEDESFQQRIVGQISASGSRTRVLGGITVFATSVNEQVVYIWFRGPALAVLSVAADYPEPRGLLRHALEVKP